MLSEWLLNSGAYMHSMFAKPVAYPARRLLLCLLNEYHRYLPLLVLERETGLGGDYLEHRLRIGVLGLFLRGGW